MYDNVDKNIILLNIISLLLNIFTIIQPSNNIYFDNSLTLIIVVLILLI